jgi:GNAT superfamily N-acetyltransferase
MRTATFGDRERLDTLLERSREDVGNGALPWLEQGGALFIEGGDGHAMSALFWREDRGGWHLDRIATVPEARGQGFGRWLMTKVEALAIRGNIPHLTLDLDDLEQEWYYLRLGYRVQERGSAVLRLHKRVGGTWQTQHEGAA